MIRRDFIRAAGAAGAAMLTNQGSAEPLAAQVTDPGASNGTPREFYLLRTYHLTRANTAICDHYLADALFPALHRMGFASPGAFALEYGPETPTTMLLLRAGSPEHLLSLDADLAKDEAFLAAAAPFFKAPGATPAFTRVTNRLSRAFAGRPTLQPPPRGSHILQLRTYESPSDADHLRKVEMFHSGEFEIFAASGMPAVFYAQDLIGDRLPSLTYMLAFPSLAELAAAWDRFRSNPDWKKLSTAPRFTYEEIVSNITNLLLSPKPFSQM